MTQQEIRKKVIFRMLMALNINVIPDIDALIDDLLNNDPDIRAGNVVASILLEQKNKISDKIKEKIKSNTPAATSSEQPIIGTLE